MKKLYYIRHNAKTKYELVWYNTYGTPTILPKLGKINKLYIKTVQKESEPFDIPVKNVKSRTTAKVSVLHRTNQQAL